MAASTITQIATWMNAAIKATTPDVRSGIPYRKASGSAPLQEQEPNGRDSQRQFQIQMAPITGLGDFVGPCYELEHEMVVVMRYVMDGRNRDDWDDLQLMAADDAKRIVLALTRPPLSAPWSDGGIFNILPVDHSPIERNERWEGVWEQSITFGLLYADEANTRDFECMTVYPDSTALTATDGTTTWLGTTRAEVRRLTDGTLYYWTGTEWLTFYQPGDVPSFASTALMEAADLTGEQLGSIGGSIYQVIAGTATLLSTGGGCLISEHTTLASLFAEAGVSGSRAALKTTGDDLVAMAFHDGTGWRLDGWINLSAAGTEGATIFSGYLATEAGRTLSWTASGLRITSTTQGYTFFQFAEEPLTIRTDINSMSVAASVAWSTTAAANKNLYIASVCGVAGARTRVYAGGVQTFGGKNRAVTLYGAIGAPSAGLSGFSADGSTSHEVSMHVGWNTGANSCVTGTFVDGATRADGEAQQNQFTPASYTDAIKEIGLNTGYGTGDGDISALYVVTA